MKEINYKVKVICRLNNCVFGYNEGNLPCLSCSEADKVTIIKV